MDKAISILSDYLKSIDDKVYELINSGEIDLDLMSHYTRKQHEINECIELLISQND